MSTKVIDLGVNGKPICDFIRLINVTFAVSAAVFEIFTLKDRQESRAAARKPRDAASVLFGRS